MSNKGKTRKRAQAKASHKAVRPVAVSVMIDMDAVRWAAMAGDVAVVREAWNHAEKALAFLAGMRNDILLNAAANGQTDVARVLIDVGVDLSPVEVEGLTLPVVAEQCGHTETARVLQAAMDRTDALRDRVRLRRVVGADSMEQEVEPARGRLM
ncbi:MAG TPA: hypothetical protein VIO59_03475 [Rhodanobacter sp.]